VFVPLDSGLSSAAMQDASERILLCLPMGVLMLPLLERTETSVRRRFMGSYHASESRAFLLRRRFTNTLPMSIAPGMLSFLDNRQPFEPCKIEPV
jgi:hypothetical protein